MAVKKTAKKPKVPKKLSFRQALMSFSILGVLWRTAIFAAFVLTMMVFSIIDMEMTRPSGVPSVFASEYVPAMYLQSLLMSVIAFFVYDGAYVAIVSRYKLRLRVDKALLLGIELGFIGISLLNYAMTYPRVDAYHAAGVYSLLNSMMVALVIAALVLPCIRAVIGASYAVAMVRTRR